MNDADTVEGCDTGQEGVEDLHDLGAREGRAVDRSIPERAAGGVVGHEVGRTGLGDHEVVDCQDVGMLDPGSSLALMAEATQGSGIGAILEDLDGDLSLEPRVKGAIHDAHSAPPKLTANLVVPDHAQSMPSRADRRKGVRLCGVSASLADLRQRWIQSGDPMDEAAWLEARVEAARLPLPRVRLAGYVGHPAALLVTSRHGGTYRRRTSKAGSGHQLRQWVIGLGDVCAPEEREVVARRSLAVVLHGLGHDSTSAALDDVFAGQPAWGLMRLVAGWAQDLLSEAGDPARVRRRVQVALAGWALALGQEARPHDPRSEFRIGERILHPRHGQGFVRRAGKQAYEAEFGGSSRRLAHRR